jgi:23S rRNA (cytosine1962-C5)-methyltransferase
MRASTAKNRNLVEPRTPGDKSPDSQPKPAKSRLEKRMRLGSILTLLEKAIAAREGLFDPGHQRALRLFNGFLEGCPELVIDLYGRTLVLHNYAELPEEGESKVQAAQVCLQARLPWLRAVIVKTRNSRRPEEKRGKLLFGEAPDRKVHEEGVWYALDLCMNRDASLYLDTRNLRLWAKTHLRDKTVLNTFAYTGSLGVAALAGGATRVVQMDLNRQFLNLAKSSYSLNGFPIQKGDFMTGDFWNQVSRLKRAGERFDCIFLDPPFYSATPQGVLDLNTDSARLINDGGWLVSVNNALYVSGGDYLQTLDGLCADGYLKIAEFIQAPEDVTGYAETRLGTPVTDPSPFNHSTKMAVLEVKRKRP